MIADYWARFSCITNVQITHYAVSAAFDTQANYNTKQKLRIRAHALPSNPSPMHVYSEYMQ